LGVGFINFFSKLHSQSVVNVRNRHNKTFVANKKPLKKKQFFEGPLKNNINIQKILLLPAKEILFGKVKRL
jgi:hypothetical protein